MKRTWVFLHSFLCSFLMGSLVDSSALPSASVVSLVGGRAVLPCSWRSRLGAAPPPVCHVQWASLADTVFEQRGGARWEADQFQGRLDVPAETLQTGNCSLIIRDVQITDTGRYQSFIMVDGGRDQRTRVFLQSVKLSVFDHKSSQSRRPGDDFVLQLHTRHSMSVVFQGSNSSVWSDLWLREDGNTERMKKHPDLEQVTMTKVQPEDEGIYKVLDENGLAVSTVKLSVEENPAPPSRRIQENIPTDFASSVGVSVPVLLFSSVLVWIFQIFHVL